MTTNELHAMSLTTLLQVAENTYTGVMRAVNLPEEKRWIAREKGAASPGQFAICLSIPLCVVFLKELKRRGIPIPEQEWLIEEFDAASNGHKKGI